MPHEGNHEREQRRVRWWKHESRPQDKHATDKGRGESFADASEALGLTSEKPRSLNPVVFAIDHRGSRIRLEAGHEGGDPEPDQLDLSDSLEGPPDPRLRNSRRSWLAFPIGLGLMGLMLWSASACVRETASKVGLHPGVLLLVLVASVFSLGWALSQRGPATRTRWHVYIRDTWESLSRERCPGCRHPLEGLPVESDGCVVCSECGAAWNLAGLREAYPFLNPPTAPPSAAKRPRRPLIVDNRGWAYPFLLRRAADEIGSELLARTKRRFHLSWEFVGLLALIACAYLASWFTGEGRTVRMSFTILAAALGVVPAIWLHGNRAGRTAIRGWHRTLVGSGVCPCCETAIPEDVSPLLGGRICPGCGGAWDPSGEVIVGDDSDLG